MRNALLLWVWVPLCFLVLVLPSFGAGPVPVYSTNGFVCTKVGMSVTCKGPIPGGKNTVMATGHNLVYLTIDLKEEGKISRYTYFSDTGCLVGYTLTPEGQIVSIAAVHRNGSSTDFPVTDGVYNKMVAFCESRQPGSPAPITGRLDSAPSEPENQDPPPPLNQSHPKKPNKK